MFVFTVEIMNFMLSRNILHIVHNYIGHHHAHNFEQKLHYRTSYLSL